jgi:hypothetical protein
MNNLSATINQSIRSITNSLYNSEKFKSIDKKDMAAIDMDTYNQQIYEEQLKKAKENRELIKKEIEEAKINLNASREKAKEREEKERLLQDQLAWNGLENDWYWGSYLNDVNKTSFSPIDNYLDKMKPDSYLPIKLGTGYKVIGDDFKEYIVPTGEQTKKSFEYKTPFRNYIYDIKYDRLIPANNVVPPEKKSEVEINDPTMDAGTKINTSFNTKYNIPSPTSPTTSPTTGSSGVLKEGFESSQLDPKLYEIYQKTLPPSEYKDPTISYDVGYTYTYIYVLIIAIILYLLFKSS